MPFAFGGRNASGKVEDDSASGKVEDGPPAPPADGAAFSIGIDMFPESLHGTSRAR